MTADQRPVDDEGPVRATSARVLVVRPPGEVLLVGSVNPEPGAPTIWVAPGGKSERGETPRQTARRELHEETGHLAEELSGPVAVTKGPAIDEYYYLLHVADLTPSGDNPVHEEQAVWVGFRWWTPEEIAGTTDIVFPVGLDRVLRQLSAGAPSTPIKLTW